MISCVVSWFSLVHVLCGMQLILGLCDANEDPLLLDVYLDHVHISVVKIE